MVALNLKPHYEAQAKERQIRKSADSVAEKIPEQKSDSRDAAGKAAGVNGKGGDRRGEAKKLWHTL
jgi:hypothetical protein